MPLISTDIWVIALASVEYITVTKQQSTAHTFEIKQVRLLKCGYNKHYTLVNLHVCSLTWGGKMKAVRSWKHSNIYCSRMCKWGRDVHVDFYAGFFPPLQVGVRQTGYKSNPSRSCRHTFSPRLFKLLFVMLLLSMLPQQWDTARFPTRERDPLTHKSFLMAVQLGVNITRKETVFGLSPGSQPGLTRGHC